MILFWLSYTAFLFDLFLETVSRAEILEKNCWFFGRFEDTKSRDIQLWPKGHFEINWPLGHLREVNGSKIENLDLKKMCLKSASLSLFICAFRKVEILVWDSYILAKQKLELFQPSFTDKVALMVFRGCTIKFI